jgi:hypothetical protein
MATRYCGPCDRLVTTRTTECPLCGADTDKVDPPKLTRQERLEGLADRGIDTFEDYRCEK